MTTSQGWFGMWACHCSQLETDRAAIPDLCPVHEVGWLVGGPTLAGVGAAPLWGFDPRIHCGCYDHNQQKAQITP